MPYVGGGVFGFVLMVLFWILVLWIIVSLIRGGGTRIQQDWCTKNSAVTILEERYAKGEIDKKEFEEKMQDLKKTHKT